MLFAPTCTNIVLACGEVGRCVIFLSVFQNIWLHFDLFMIQEYLYYFMMSFWVAHHIV